MPDNPNQVGEDNKLREALAEIAGIASQRGTDKQMFSMEDYRRLGDIERLARRVLRDPEPEATDGE